MWSKHRNEIKSISVPGLLQYTLLISQHVTHNKSVETEVIQLQIDLMTRKIGVIKNLISHSTLDKSDV